MASWFPASSVGWKHTAQSRTHSIFWRWKACLANQHGGERGRLTLRWSNKNGRIFDSNVFFFCLTLLREVKTKRNSSEEKQVILAVRAWICHQKGHHFIYPSKLRSKGQLLQWPGVNIQLSAMRGMASTVWHVNVVCLPQIQLQVVTTRGCKASCGSSFRFQAQKLRTHVLQAFTDFHLFMS